MTRDRQEVNDCTIEREKNVDKEKLCTPQWYIPRCIIIVDIVRILFFLSSKYSFVHSRYRAAMLFNER